MNKVSVGSYIDLTLTAALEGKYVDFGGKEPAGPVIEASVGAVTIEGDVREGVFLRVQYEEGWRNVFLPDDYDIQVLDSNNKEGETK